MKRFTPLATLVALLAGSTSLLAQAPPPPPVPPSPTPQVDPLAPRRPTVEAAAEVEVLTRGPLHEAFLIQPQLNPEPGPIITQEPPAPIEELVPEVRPDDPSAIWIEGYWHFDPDAKEFIWVSGVWRIPPPDYTWVPGVWQPVTGGFQWLSGLWVPVGTEELVYQDPPPESLERGPSSPAPGDDYYYVCGAWEMEGGRYLWRAGYWAPIHPGWIWVPSHYLWAGRRVVFVRGYWDREVEKRGYPFAWVRVIGRGHVRFRPEIYLPAASLKYHLFARAGYTHYYYGDFYGDQHARIGFTPWYRGANVVYQPMVSYYRWSYARTGVVLDDRLGGWTTYFERNVEHRPPVTYAAQAVMRNTLRAEDQIRDLVIPAQKVSDRVLDAGAQVRKVTQRESDAIRDRTQQWTEFSKNRVLDSSQTVRNQTQNAVDRVRLPNIPGPIGGGRNDNNIVPNIPGPIGGGRNSGGRRFGFGRRD